jgi:hypothetical protein
MFIAHLPSVVLIESETYPRLEASACSWNGNIGSTTASMGCRA